MRTNGCPSDSLPAQGSWSSHTIKPRDYRHQNGPHREQLDNLYRNQRKYPHGLYGNPADVLDQWRRYATEGKGRLVKRERVMWEYMQTLLSKIDSRIRVVLARSVGVM